MSKYKIQHPVYFSLSVLQLMGKSGEKNLKLDRKRHGYIPISSLNSPGTGVESMLLEAQLWGRRSSKLILVNPHRMQLYLRPR